MPIVNMKCNHIENPLGFNLGQPRLSWVTAVDEAKVQLAAWVEVSLESDFTSLVYDTGKRPGSRQPEV